jgi:FKBP-type peptidyl-prolyl cis-trans isomerase 2
MPNSEKNSIVKKNDFIELEFLARNSLTNEVFDSNILEEAKKLNYNIKDVKPLVICVGQKMVVSGFDESLEGKETGKKYNIKLTPDKAFGPRRKDLVRLIPMKVFVEQKIYPQPGMTLALDNNLVKVISVSGGRVLVDFNNPLAGKDIEYEFTVKKIIPDNSDGLKEKISALQKFLFNQEFPVDIDEANKKIIFKDTRLMQLLDVFKTQFKEMLGFDVEILAKKEDESKGKLKPQETAGVLGKEENKEVEDRSEVASK